MKINCIQETLKSLSSFGCTLINTGIFQNFWQIPDPLLLFKISSALSFCDLNAFFLCIQAGSCPPSPHVFSISGLLRISLPSTMYSASSASSFFQSGWQHCQSHYFDQADVFFLDVMILSMRVIYPQWMFFCRNIITQGKIQFEHAVPHSRDRSDRIVWLSICIRIDECIFICIVSPASEDMICQSIRRFSSL